MIVFDPDATARAGENIIRTAQHGQHPMAATPAGCCLSTFARGRYYCVSFNIVRRSTRLVRRRGIGYKIGISKARNRAPARPNCRLTAEFTHMKSVNSLQRTLWIYGVWSCWPNRVKLRGSRQIMKCAMNLTVFLFVRRSLTVQSLEFSFRMTS